MMGLHDIIVKMNALIECFTIVLILMGGAFIYPTYKITLHLNMLGIPNN